MKLVDLFSGCGGFSLGAHKAGFRVAAAFDNDPILSSSYAHNFPHTKVQLRDIGKLDGRTIRATAGSKITGIFGGPPCQGFSDIGLRNPSDPRRQLLGHFFRLVNEIRPDFFVMENVRGLAYADARQVLEKSLIIVKDLYEMLGPQIWDAADFGAATKRPRLFVIGIHKNRGDGITIPDIARHKRPAATVQDAISDLEGAVRVGIDKKFDLWKLADGKRSSSYATALRALDGHFTGQLATVHTRAVVKRFEGIAEGEVDPIGRHPRLSWLGQCPTLRAGTGPDRGSYQSVRPIHPKENRVISVREAARLQGFPDQHRFHPTIWHSFRMIGNSVSPFIAEAIFTAIAEKLEIDIADAISEG